MSADDHLRRAAELCDRVVFAGDSGVLPEADRALDAVEAALALARGRVIHSRFLDERVEDPHELALFERSAALYETLGDTRGHARARFQIGVYHQVVHGDNAAVPEFERSHYSAGRSRTDGHAIGLTVGKPTAGRECDSATLLPCPHQATAFSSS